MSVNLQELIKLEKEKCKADYGYAIRKYFTIQHPVRGKVLFDLYPFQEKVMKDMMDHRWYLILKSRQLGISTLVGAYSLCEMLFKDDFNVLVIATKQDVAKNLITKIRVMNENLPSWLKQPTIEDNKLSLRFKNGSQVKAVSSKSDSGRSEALSLLIVDEAAFVPGMEELWASLQPTLSAGGSCILLSSPNGQGNLFHREYMKAESGEGQFSAIKLPWHVHPDRDQKWRDLQTDLLGESLANQECFEGSTKIFTKNGYQEIKNVNVGDEVLTHKGNFKKVIRVYKKIANNNLCKIHTYLNRNEKIVTGNHPFLDYNGRWTNISDLSTGDKVTSFIKINNYFDNKKYFIDLYELHKPKHFKKILIEDGTKFYVNDRRHKRQYNRKIEVNYDLGYIIGYYLAEGHKRNEAVSFSFNYETELNTTIKRISDIIETIFNTTPYLHIAPDGSKSATVSFCSTVFSDFMSNFVNGSSCYDKKLNNSVYSFKNKNFFKGILDGYLEGDGCIRTNYTNKKVSSVSNELIYDISYISKILGYTAHSTLVRKKPKKQYILERLCNINDVYILNYLGTKFKDIDIDSSFSNSIKPLKEHKYRDYIYKKNNTVYSKIFVKKLDDFEIDVYNLEVEDDNSYVTEHAVVHNCDADFLLSGQSVVEATIIQWYKDTYVIEPMEKRGVDGNYWIWEYPAPGKNYLVTADVARGDASDYSTFHVLDLISLTQVAEYKGKVDTSTFGNMLVSVSTDYNDAILVVDNNSVGWNTISVIVDRGYKNLFYSYRNEAFVDGDIYLKKGYDLKDKSDMIPGLSITNKTKPLIVDSFTKYMREKTPIIHSSRLIEELFVYIWNNGKPEAAKGYNDDLVMALAGGLWVRDTALRLKQLGVDLTRRSVSGIKKAVYIPAKSQNYSWDMDIMGKKESIKWLL